MRSLRFLLPALVLTGAAGACTTTDSATLPESRTPGTRLNGASNVPPPPTTATTDTTGTPETARGGFMGSGA